ncbi:PspA/IM30 family protein [Synechococcus sp. H60.3]|uniref:PspA/IM30 family protein n=1 Tax=unclassified Synechococcus TaxID=2626047 RepID=UPI0039C3771B
MASRTSLLMTAAVLSGTWFVLPAAAQSSATARVRSVVDGDTFWADLNGRPTRFRLAYVDAPELTQGRWGRLSQEALQSLLPPGSLVQVDTLYVTPEGLHIAQVYNSEGLVNLEMLRQGQAAVYERFLYGANRERYLEAQELAQAARRGFWQQRNPVMPWEFRETAAQTSAFAGSNVLDGSFLRENPAAAAGVGIATAVVMVGLSKVLWKKPRQKNASIRQMERDLKQLRRSLATTLASCKQLERQYDQLLQKAEDWFVRAEKASQHDQDELARQALVQRNQHMSAAEAVRRSLDEVEAQATAIREGISRLESQIAMAKLEREMNN